MIDNQIKIPKISIVTITYNSEKTLERTIKSIVEQDYDNLEYIIVDGGSTDHTIDIIKKYNNKIAKWVSEPDKGISDAFNKGIKMATGTVIGIINSDDGLLPGALNAVARAYQEDIDVYRGNVLLWKEDSDTKVVEVPSMRFDFSGMNKISHQSTFVTKSAYSKFGCYNINCKYVMDYDLLLRFQKAGARFKYIDQTLAFYTLGGITFSCNISERMNEVKRVMKNNGGSDFDYFKYSIVKRAKLLMGKILPKELTMKIRNGQLFKKSEK